jgi:hypothetical protein
VNEREELKFCLGECPEAYQLMLRKSVRWRTLNLDVTDLTVALRVRDQ